MQYSIAARGVIITIRLSFEGRGRYRNAVASGTVSTQTLDLERTRRYRVTVLTLLLSFHLATCESDLFHYSSGEFWRRDISIDGCDLSGSQHDSVTAIGDLVGEGISKNRSIDFYHNVCGVV